MHDMTLMILAAMAIMAMMIAKGEHIRLYIAIAAVPNSVAREIVAIVMVMGGVTVMIMVVIVDRGHFEAEKIQDRHCAALVIGRSAERRPDTGSALVRHF
jgi:hypothetical protein